MWVTAKSVLLLLMFGLLAGCDSAPNIPDPEAEASQKEVFDKLKGMEANVTLDEEGKITSVGFESKEQGDAAVALLKDIPTLKSVELAGSGVTSAGLKHLEGMKSLEYVGLEDTKVSAAAVKKLKGTLSEECRVAFGSGDD